MTYRKHVLSLLDSDDSIEENPADAPIEVQEEAEKDVREPPRFAVILHNDDYTTMEFVIEILKKYFQKSDAEAMRTTLEVHHAGRGVAGIYSFEIAETKAAQVIESARRQGYPLQCTVEEHSPK